MNRMDKLIKETISATAEFLSDPDTSFDDKDPTIEFTISALSGCLTWLQSRRKECSKCSK